MTTGGESLWSGLRRVHFYVSDVFFREAARIDIDFATRRILDYMDFAETRGAPCGVTVRDLCELIPPRPRSQQVAATLDRLRHRGWVQQRDERRTGPRRGRLWHLTATGQEARSAYKALVEEILQDVYRDTKEAHLKALLQHWNKVNAFINQNLERVLQVAAPSIAELPISRNPWSTLRQAHFYTNDLFFKEVDPLGVTPENRRLLDAFRLARSLEVDSLTVAMLVKLIETPATPQAMVTVLSGMRKLAWVEVVGPVESGPASTWRLIDRGQIVHATCNRTAEDFLRGVYADRGLEPHADLHHVARTADGNRARRLEPIVALNLDRPAPAQ